MSSIVETNIGSQYSDEDRRNAAYTYAIMGNVQRVAETVSIPDRTLYDWTKQDWWLELVATIREEKKDELDSTFSRALEKATEKLEQRIDLGDAYVKKDGDIGYKDVSARDLATVTGIMFDKRQLLRNQATSIKAESTDSRLNMLAEKVRELSAGQNKVISGESEEVKD